MNVEGRHYRTIWTEGGGDDETLYIIDQTALPHTFRILPLRSVEDVRHILSMGADKAAINTAALRRPELIGEVARAFGSQCMVLSVQAKRRNPADPSAGWEAYYDNGREHSGRDVLEWVKEGVARGAGEILLTGVDKEGFRNGLDQALIAAVCAAVPVPVIAAGGASGAGDSILHYGDADIPTLKEQLARQGVEVRVCGRS